MTPRHWTPIVARAALGCSLALLPAACAATDAHDSQGVRESQVAREQVAPDPVRYWELPTGSRIAYRHVAPERPTGLPPLLFLHGGPGAYIVARFDDSPEWWQRLAALGFDVYAFDQVGSGLSARLPDPTQYTAARHVADLEAIRVLIAAERMVLIGDSWGASLAARYIAAHPEQVAGAIFTSPGAIDHRSWNPTLSTPQFSPAMLEWVRTSRGRDQYRRCLALDSLLRRGAVRDAYARFGDAEMDPLLDAWVSAEIMETTVHDPARLGDERMDGMGWWVQHMTAFDLLSTAPAIRPRLAKYERPVLILHGTSDYLPAGMSREYAETFPHARLVDIPDTGHLIWLERPDVYGGEIVGYLEGLRSGGVAAESAGSGEGRRGRAAPICPPLARLDSRRFLPYTPCR